MAGEVEERFTLQAESLPTGSISFGRFELESLSWERRSSFSHNRYLEEVEKYSTPGSVTKKKEYFEAHFKKKGLLHQVPEENQNEIGMQQFENIEFAWGNEYTPAVPEEHEAVERQKEDMSTEETSTKFSFLNDEIFAEPFNEHSSSDGTLQKQSGHNTLQLEDGRRWAVVEDKAPNANAKSIKQAENGDALSKTCRTTKMDESIQMKTKNVSVKTCETVKPRVGRLQSKAHIPTQHIYKKPLNSRNSVTHGMLKQVEKQDSLSTLEKRTSKASSLSPENGNLKSTASRNPTTKASSEIKSEEIIRVKKVGLNLRAVDRKGSDTRQPMGSRVKLVSKEDEKQNNIVFNFKSSERAEKRKEYNLKLEKRLRAKEAEMSKIQAKTEVVKEAEIKQLRRSLNFKATPMPSFYQENASTVSDIKKAPAKSKEKSAPSSSSNQNIEHSHSQTISPSISAAVGDCSIKKAEILKREMKKHNASLNQADGMGKKGGTKNRIRNGVKGIVDGSVAVRVAF